MSDTLVGLVSVVTAFLFGAAAGAGAILYWLRAKHAVLPLLFTCTHCNEECEVHLSRRQVDALAKEGKLYGTCPHCKEPVHVDKGKLRVKASA